MDRNKYLTVTVLSQYIKRKFDVDPYLGRVYLVGEISNFRMRPNAHQYFSLKDEKAKISAIMFKGAFSKLKFQPEEGMKVLVTGRISVYEPSGSYQIYVDSMEPDGVGALYQAYEQLKLKLQQEGVFDLPKRPISKFPKKIAVITSESGAVIRDIITTTMRRFPIVQLILFPAQVQGDKSAADLVRQINHVNEYDDFDTLIIGRGGGSIEDLWPFNEETVARAILSSKIPVISSVGHETDTTIADLVADVRAATPTAAAELATPELSQLLLKITDSRNRIYSSQIRQIDNLSDALKKIQHRSIMQNPERIYDVYLQKLDQLDNLLKLNFKNILNKNKNTTEMLYQQLNSNSPKGLISKYESNITLLNQKLLNNIATIFSDKKNIATSNVQKLDSLSPLKTLTRGYAVISNEQGKMLSKTEDFKENDKINIQVSNGVVNAVVDGAKNGK